MRPGIITELARCETFWKSLTTEPVLRDFAQLDNLQAAVLQLEIVVAFEEIAVICKKAHEKCCDIKISKVV